MERPLLDNFAYCNIEILLSLDEFPEGYQGQKEENFIQKRNVCSTDSFIYPI